jgi:spore coat protein U-like protein
MRIAMSRLLLLPALFVLTTAQTARAPLCTITNATPLTFNGPVGDPNRPSDGRASFTVTCAVTLTTSISLLYSHAMKGGEKASRLAYDLYADPQRSVIWGNGADGTIVRQTIAGGQPTTVYIYARIPPQQKPSAGRFTDSVEILTTP